MIVAKASELCQKCDFFLKKRMEEIFTYVLEFMFILAKMQDNITLILKKIRSETGAF